MNTEFFCAVLLCLIVPILIGKCFGIQRLFPIVFLQLLFGLLLNTTGLSIWLQTHGIDLLQGPLVTSLNGLGWLGLSLLIALTGAESSPLNDTQKAWRFIPISIVGFGATCALGSLFGYQLALHYPQLLGSKQQLFAFALAIGLSLSVTALPILCAVLRENSLTDTLIGKLATNCALLDDLWMWLVLAAILSLVTNTRQPTIIVLYLLIYLGVMLLMLRPLLRKYFEHRLLISPGDGLLIAITVICLSAIATDLMGLHAIFGAYIAGVALPRQAWGTKRNDILHFSQLLLLPFFFVLTGMRLQIPIADVFFWQLTLTVTFVATACKFLSVTLTARLTGLKWLEASILGSLMQCKGLMELVAINILFEAGIISLQIFSALAMMALISTFITAPLMRVLLPKINNR
ncbi:MAG: cation:proton antiporter [Methylococcaceae bacterium]|nr:cation:proton antiporter [Methylococcaceae bacterium]